MIPDDARQTVLNEIDKLTEHAADILMELIRYPSVCGEEMGAVNHMKDILTDAGFSPTVVPMDQSIKDHKEYSKYTKEPAWEGRGNLVTDFGGKKGGHSLAINAHLDVVPADGWPDGYTPKRNGDAIIGRGACDDKGGVVASYLAARALKNAGIVPAGRLSLHHVIDEETGGNGTLSLLNGGYTADAAIVGECTDNVLCPANRGAIWFQLTTTGISTHMGEIDNGVSALDKAWQAVGILREYEKWMIENYMDHPYFNDLPHRPIQLCVGMMNTGEWPSMVPDECRVEGGMGFLPNRDIDDVKAEMIQWIKDRGDEWLREHFELRYDKLHNAAFEVPPDHPFVKSMQSGAVSAGMSDKITGWPVSCDARLFPRVADMPVICAGPGKLKHAHSTTEQVLVTELAQAAKLYACTAMDWCGIA